MTEFEITATRGEPYRITRDDRGLVRLGRQMPGGKVLWFVFARQDVIAVCNGLIDVLEAK